MAELLGAELFGADLFRAELRGAAMEADLTGAAWQKASGTGEPGEPCVEIAIVPGAKEGSDQVIAMRDSGNPGGPVLIFTPDEWRAFTAGVRDGEFDLP